MTPSRAYRSLKALHFDSTLWSQRGNHRTQAQNYLAVLLHDDHFRKIYDTRSLQYMMTNTSSTGASLGQKFRTWKPIGAKIRLCVLGCKPALYALQQPFLYIWQLISSHFISCLFTSFFLFSTSSQVISAHIMSALLFSTDLNSFHHFESDVCPPLLTSFQVVSTFLNSSLLISALLFHLSSSQPFFLHLSSSFISALLSSSHLISSQRTSLLI